MIIIHPGAPKTGTTALQNFLFDASDRLREIGIEFPDCGLSRSGGHKDFRVSLNRSSLSDPYFDKIRSDFNGVFETTKDVLISCELLWSVDPRRIIESYPFLKDAHILVYLRRQDSMIESHYAQKVKGGVTELLPKEFYRKNMLDYDYDAFCNNWAEVFGSKNVHPRIYESSKKNGIVSDFLVKGIGSLLASKGRDYRSDFKKLIEVASDNARKKSNLRIHPSLTKTLLALNRTSADAQTKEQLRRELLKDFRLWNSLEKKENIFSESLLKKITKDFEESNSKVKSKYFPSARRPNLFSN
ncbi:MAG: hypothetical protein NXI13_13165 [Proteobacteria bacterium]|nr:hypothetical protein [Pseudomonadota bacterium]